MQAMQSEEKLEVLKEPETDVDVPEEHNTDIDEREEQIENVVSAIIQRKYSGPIPPPSSLRGYEEVLPGSADRILSMAERQSQHRQDMEKKMVNSESRDSLLGILFAFALCSGFLVTAIVTVVMVPEGAGAVSAAVIGASGIGTIIGTFIKSTRISKKDG